MEPLLPTSLVFRKALPEDAVALTQLVNDSYRGEASRLGWTTEADLLDGLRTTAQDILQSIQMAGSIFLLCFNNDQMIASIHMELTGNSAHFGMFVVMPALQGQGIGKHLLAQAERLAKVEWQVDKYVMYVITRRHELIDFYNRRGYQPTGQYQEFPENPAVWAPKVDGLRLAILEKPA